MENHEKHGYILWIIVAIVLTAILVGGGVYYWQNKKATETQNDLNNQITNLQNQINTLKSTNSTTSTSNTTNNTTNTSTSTTDEMANWNTYTNSKYNYTFKYPTNWGLIDYLYNSVSNQVVNQYDHVFLEDKAIAPNSYAYGVEGVPFFEITAMDARDSIPSFADNSDSYTKSIIDINGIQGTKIVYKNPSSIDNTYYTTIYFTHNDQNYKITYQNDNAAGDHNSNFDKIISAIQFTN